MFKFKLGFDIIDYIINTIDESESYIRIAMFQIHNKKIFEILNKKLKEGVKVEILTLPYDSINNDIQNDVKNRFKQIIENGAKLYFCKWNIGDPERTTTAVGRWYSFHGKFLVTDKNAIILSANFTEKSELDALISFENNQNKIDEFNFKFNQLLELFIIEYSGYNGNIRNKIIETAIPFVESLFELPRVIETDTHKNHWIQDYPSSICEQEIFQKDKLFISPFDIKGRNIYLDLLSHAKEFVYISTESFTDIEFSEELIKNKLRDIDVKILTGSTSMDFQDRMQKMLRELLANKIDVNTINEDLHAKFILTDKGLAVGSINLNKMNLGFKRKSSLWRANTETIYYCTNNEIISNAQSQFLEIFKNSIDISNILSEKIESQVGRMFTSFYGLKSKKVVKSLFARFILANEIKVKSTSMVIGKITLHLMRTQNKKMVDKDDFLLALILYYLSERKHDLDQLDEKLSILNTKYELKNLISFLVNKKFIEKEEDYYKLSVYSLF